MASKRLGFFFFLAFLAVFQSPLSANADTAPSAVSFSFPPSNKFGCFFDPRTGEDVNQPATAQELCLPASNPSRLILAYFNGVTSARYQYKTKVQLWKKNSKWLASFNAYFVVNFDRDAEFTQRPLFSGGGIAFAFTPDTNVVGTELFGRETFGLFPINEQTGASLLGAKTKTVAVELDLSRIANVGFDPLCPHVGLDINSMKSVTTKYMGDANTIIDVKHGVWIEYDALTKTLKVFLHKVKVNQTPNRNNANIAITYKGLDLAKEVNEFSYVGLASRIPETSNGVYVVYDLTFSTKWVLGTTVNT